MYGGVNLVENPGYKLEHCRKNCLKSSQDWQELYTQLEKLLIGLNLPAHFAKHFHRGNYHNIPKIALAGCPNGCSQPQIKDIGISGYLTPKITDDYCSGCLQCINSCHENALTWDNGKVVISSEHCMNCGDCVRACTTGRIAPGESGWVLHYGGHLGRHPQLAKIAGIEKDSSEVIRKIQNTLEDYLRNALPGERLNTYLNRQR